jgi:O-antigen/teichoic acid export membrane protein
MLDVQAVAAIAATRLLLMPVNLLSTGISQMMLPTAARWLHLHGVAPLYRRLLYFCVGVSVVALCYCAFMWVIRDWVFTNVLKKQFANRDTLLLLWSLIFLFMMLRDQLAHLLVVRGRMHLLTMTTFVSAALALTASFLAIRRFEVPGALIGVLIGEIVNVMGIVFFTNIESRRPAPDSGAASPS